MIEHGNITEQGEQELSDQVIPWQGQGTTLTTLLQITINCASYPKMLLNTQPPRCSATSNKRYKK